MAKKRKFSSGAARAAAAAAVAGPGSGGTMFKNIPSEITYFNPEVPKGKTSVKYTLRFLPYIVADEKHPDGENAPVDDIWYKRPFKRVRAAGVDKKPFISPKSIGMPCPIHEYYIQAKADPSIPDKEAAKAKLQDCVMYNVQEIDKKGNAGPVMFWWMSYHLFEKQLKKELLDPDNEKYLGFFDLEGGFDVKVRFEKESFEGNTFLCADMITFIERKKDLDESILDEVVDLDNVLVVKGYDELRNIFLEIEDDDSESPAPKNEKGRKNKTAEPESEEEDEDECPHGLNFGEDFGSNKKCKKCKVKTECEEASDEEEEEEEESLECPHNLDFGEDFGESKKCKKCKIKTECEAASTGEEEGDEDEEEHDDKPSREEISSMKKKELKDVIKQYKLDVDIDDHPKLANLREAIIDELHEESGDEDGNSSPETTGKCPNGHKWAVDYDEEHCRDDCDDCKVWEACSDAQDELDG